MRSINLPPDLIFVQHFVFRRSLVALFFQYLTKLLLSQTNTETTIYSLDVKTNNFADWMVCIFCLCGTCNDSIVQSIAVTMFIKHTLVYSMYIKIIIITAPHLLWRQLSFPLWRCWEIELGVSHAVRLAHSFVKIHKHRFQSGPHIPHVHCGSELQVFVYFFFAFLCIEFYVVAHVAVWYSSSGLTFARSSIKLNYSEYRRGHNNISFFTCLQ